MQPGGGGFCSRGAQLYAYRAQCGPGQAGPALPCYPPHRTNPRWSVVSGWQVPSLGNLLALAGCGALGGWDTCGGSRSGGWGRGSNTEEAGVETEGGEGGTADLASPSQLRGTSFSSAREEQEMRSKEL